MFIDPLRSGSALRKEGHMLTFRSHRSCTPGSYRLLKHPQFEADTALLAEGQKAKPSSLGVTSTLKVPSPTFDYTPRFPYTVA